MADRDSKQDIKVLLLEDSASDAELMMRELQKAGYCPDWVRVQTEQEYSERLNSEIDLIIADYNLPDFDGIHALDLLQQRGLDIPYILVSGSVGEDIAVEALQRGAADYLLKDRLSRLGPAVERALDQDRLKRERKVAHELLVQVNGVLHTILGVHQLLLRERDPERLLEKACQMLLQTQGYRMAWVGLVEDGHKRVVPVARAGRGSDYLDNITVTWDESDTGQGPTGRSLRTRQPVTVRDKNDEPSYVPWRELAKSYGFASSVSVPMLHGDRLFGALNVYADVPDAFGEEEIWLFQELAADLAFALHIIEEEAKHKRAQEELKQAYSEMEVRIAERTAELEESNRSFRRAKEEAEQASAEAEQANQAKSEFLSRMSHELRTPLNAILGFGQILQMYELPPKAKEGVEHILAGGQHLLQLINEVLEITRSDAGRMEIALEAVSVREVVSEVAELIQPLAAEAKVALKVEPPIAPTQYVLADKQRLKQVLLNLMANAVKYNNAGGCVCVTSTLKDDDKVKIAVRDNGFGIAEVDIKKLFMPFERLGAEARQVEGTGLGLMLSKHLTEAMGGTIQVSSELAQGSTFSVEMPTSAPPVECITTKPSSFIRVQQTADERVRRVLLIEDNIANYKLVEAVLEEASCIELIGAMQGSIGLDLARRQQPDLILLDLHLPDISGREVLLKLREEDRTREIPVVIVSADATLQQIDDLMAAGAHSYLTKPIDIRQLLKVVSETLGVKLN